MLDAAAPLIAQRLEKTGLSELAAFGVHCALACVFPVTIFAGLAVLRHVPHRYDLMLVICLLTQAWMVRAKLETHDEVKVITLFHLLGLAMEIHKVRIGSWTYPEEAWTKVAGVPLYSGFMYASVASFMCQAWRRLALRVERWPGRGAAFAVAALLYLNFISNHWMSDERWPLVFAALVVFRRTRVHLTPHRRARAMPMIFAFALIALFVWFGEQIGTYLGAWRYPSQALAWQPVNVALLSSWFCLVIVSLVLVGELKRLKRLAPPPAPARGT